VGKGRKWIRTTTEASRTIHCRCHFQLWMNDPTIKFLLSFPAVEERSEGQFFFDNVDGLGEQLAASL
jgi:hypothetical protein